MLTRIRFLTFFLFLVSVLFFSCKEDEEPEFLSFDLDVKYENGAYQLSWTPANISSFEEYILLYKTNPLPVSFNHVTHANSQKIIITEQTLTSFTWEIPPDSEKIYFQVFVLFEGREIQSNIVEFENTETDVVYFNVDKTIHYPAKDALYFFDSSIRELKYYDLKNRESITDRNIGFYFTEFATGDNGFGEELYLIKDGTDLVTLDANTLEEKNTYITGETVTSVTTNENGLIVLAITNPSGSVRVLNRSDWSIVNEFDYSMDNTFHGVAFLSKENNTLVETSRERIDKYELDGDGSLVNHNFILNPFESESNNTNLVVSQEGNYFVNSRYGEVYDGTPNDLFRVYSLDANNYFHYLFNKGETDLYAIHSGFNGVSIGIVHKINLGTMEIVDSRGIYFNDPLILFLDGEKVMLVAKNGSSSVVIRPLGF